MKELDGAWEPKGYIGPRVEIEGKKLTRLWKGTSVLETKFSIEKEGDKTVLKLKNHELRYPNDRKAYATVKECYVQDDTLVLVDDFPITGESRDELVKTENSRYGDVTIVDDEFLPVLQGKWKCTTSDMCMEFDGNTVKFGYNDSMVNNSIAIVTVRYRYDFHSGDVYIIDKDPAKEFVGMFGKIVFRGGILSTYIPVCDANPQYMIFEKI